MELGGGIHICDSIDIIILSGLLVILPLYKSVEIEPKLSANIVFCILYVKHVWTCLRKKSVENLPKFNSKYCVLYESNFGTKSL